MWVRLGRVGVAIMSRQQRAAARGGSGSTDPAC